MSKSANRHMVIGAALMFAVLAVIAGAFTMLSPRNVTQDSNMAMIGGPFRLVSHEGREVSDQDFRGAPALVFFGYTHCPDVCPTALFQISEIFNALGQSAKISALFISVDPERDTPEILKSFISSFDRRIIGLSGEPGEVEKAKRAYRVYAKKKATSSGDYTVDHTSIIYLMDKRGRFVDRFAIDRAPTEAAADLLKHL